jgi:hypothetical protein
MKYHQKRKAQPKYTWHIPKKHLVRRRKIPTTKLKIESRRNKIVGVKSYLPTEIYLYYVLQRYNTKLQKQPS